MSIFPDNITVSSQECTGDAVSAGIRQARVQTVPTILICSHMSRDRRCGVLGPLLYKEFGRFLQGPFWHGQPQPVMAMVSHIGGHAWAGNVIVYFPPLATYGHLAGQGVWYGRVEPRHVEGILVQTLRNGYLIEELLRGVTSWPQLLAQDHD